MLCNVLFQQVLDALTEAWHPIALAALLRNETKKTMPVDGFSRPKLHPPSLQGSCRNHGFFRQGSPQELVAVGGDCQLLRTGIAKKLVFLCCMSGITRHRRRHRHFSLPQQVFKDLDRKIDHVL